MAMSSQAAPAGAWKLSENHFYKQAAPAGAFQTQRFLDLAAAGEE